MPRKTSTPDVTPPPVTPKKPAKAAKPVAAPAAEAPARKPRRKAAPATPEVTLASTLVEADIAAEAYLLWLADGQPHGKDVEHWTRAEEIVRGRQAAAA